MSLDHLRAAILADDGLQQRLITLYDPAAFVPAVLEFAATHDIAMDANTLRAALAVDPAGIDRFMPRAATGLAWPGLRYLPVALSSSATELTIDWINVDGRLTAPFYQETIQQSRHRPLNQLIRPRTPLAQLAPLAPADGRRVPSGFVFHMSRCGSTLVAQMLAADPANIVVSEAPPLDQIIQLLQARPDMPIEQRAEILRAFVAAFGRERYGESGDFVIKLDSWHTIALPLLRRAFPETPWVYLYRDPIEVLVSHARMPGLQAVPGTMPGVYDIPDEDRLHPTDYTATVLAQIGTAALDHFALGGGLLINYDALPQAIETQILPHFGIAPSAAGLAAMRAAAARNSKAPGDTFVADTAQKQREATPVIRAAAEIVADSYAGLERLRRGDIAVR